MAATKQSKNGVEQPIEMVQGTPRTMPIERITAYNNPRTEFDVEGIARLAESVRTHGLLQPVIVRPAKGLNQYNLISGERRLRACKLLGLTDIPAIVHADLSDRTAAEMALIENLQRADLTPIETAEAFRSLHEAGCTEEEIGFLAGMSQSAVSNTLRLLKLPEEVQALLRQRKLTQGHGVVLLKYASFPEACIQLAQVAAAEEWPVSNLNDRDHVLEALLYGTEHEMAVEIVETFVGRHHCLNCPYGALVGKEGTGICLNPSHFNELVAQAAEGQRSTPPPTPPVTQAHTPVHQLNGNSPSDTTRQLSDDDSVVDVCTLGIGQYDLIDADSPSGCSGSCPCRRVTEAGQAICINPSRYSSLKGVDTATERKAKQKLADTTIEAFEESCHQLRHHYFESDDSNQFERKCLAVILRTAMRRSASIGHIDLKQAYDESFTKVSDEMRTALTSFGHSSDGDQFEYLCQAHPSAMQEALLAVAGFALRVDLATYLQTTNYQDPVIARFLASQEVILDEVVDDTDQPSEPDPDDNNSSPAEMSDAVQPEYEVGSKWISNEAQGGTVWQIVGFDPNHEKPYEMAADGKSDRATAYEIERRLTRLEDQAHLWPLLQPGDRLVSKRIGTWEYSVIKQTTADGEPAVILKRLGMEDQSVCVSHADGNDVMRITRSDALKKEE